MSVTDTRGVPFNDLITSVLLEVSHTHGIYTIKWRQMNEQQLVFAAIYNKTLRVPYIDALLDQVSQRFVQKYGSSTKYEGEALSRNYNFDETFQGLWQQIQEETRAKKAGKKPGRFEDTKKGQRLRKEGKLKESSSTKADESESESEDEPEQEPNTDDTNSEEEEIDFEEERKRFLARRAKKGNKTPGGYVPKNKKSTPKSTKKGKKSQTWGKITEEEANALNFSATSEAEYDVDDGADLGVDEVIDLNAFDDDSDEDVQESSGGFFSYISSLTNKTLTEEDVEPALKKFEEHLFTLNVARNVAQELCDSVKETLTGKKHSTFSSLTKTVREAMVAALTKILTPKRSIDVLRDVRAKANKPFVITFVGVNGVGKSTSLAKVCSWLLQNRLKVLIAACDTFRSGAVEQLQTHARRLKVEVYHRGYGRDAAAVCGEAIRKAKKEDIDVVLVDTAGRMQENEPLMKALGKLVATNDVDLTLFVGEALVGNDSVDQLTKFNLAIEEYGGKGARGIDGIILSKFDTVDEKVGAAISMVYSTGLPIVFTGVGQKYSDLRILDVKRVVNILQKGV